VAAPDISHPSPATGRLGRSRRTLAGLSAGGFLAVAAAAFALFGTFSHHAVAHARDVASVPAARSAGGRASGTTSAPSSSVRPVAEVRDPEEAASFPVPSSVHHAAAARPSKVAEEIVAPGAPSNAEIRSELAKMRAIESAARSAAAADSATVPGGDSVGGDGQIPIPPGIPEVVQRVIAGANAIADFPYVYGGGHASFVSSSYDCSGSVSYALAAGGLLGVPETSGALESWGEPGPGQWITIYASAGHVYMYVNIGGRWMRFDTVGRSGPFASRWQPSIRSNAGFVARHPPGL
jgi:cell wall-associated NlpC family hydrolase